AVALPRPRASGSRLISSALSAFGTRHVIQSSWAQRMTWSQPPSGSSLRPEMLKAKGTLNARATTLPGDAGEHIVVVPVEHRWRKVELCHRVVPHEFRPDRVQVGSEDPGPKIGPLPQCKDFQIHDACLALNMKPLRCRADPNPSSRI